ncbi:MAG: ThuA domain-containing protein [Armatimonadota bacterium]
MNRRELLACGASAAALVYGGGFAAAADDPWLALPGKSGPGSGKKVVLISGDQEYRSEETMPQLARILSERHGFDCTVLFTVDPSTGTVNPTINNIPGLEKLRDADLLILFTRMLDLPADQMKPIAEYVESGRPIVALRTSTHAFSTTAGDYARYHWQSKEPGWEGGFGRRVLGETWISHHGEHGKEGTRGVVAPGQELHPIVRGIEPGAIFGTTDVYGVRLPLPESTPVVMGQVTATLEPDSAPVTAKNAPMMPVAWTRSYRGEAGKPARIFVTTMGASQDFAYEGTRRMIVNGAYWALGLEDRLPAKSDVRLVGRFEPTPFRFKKAEEWKPGRKPSEL